MKLTAANTAVVLDSTADFPDAPARFSNFRVVPLYVQFGDESLKDYVEITPDEFYERLTHERAAADDLAADAGRLRGVYDELAPATSGSSRSRSRPRSPGRSQSAEAASAGAGDGKVRVIDSRTVSASLALLALGVQQRLEAGTTDEEIDAYVERYRHEHGSSSPSTRSSTWRRAAASAGGGVRRQPAERQADPRRSGTARSCR